MVLQPTLGLNLQLGMTQGLNVTVTYLFYIIIFLGQISIFLVVLLQFLGIIFELLPNFHYKDNGATF